MKYTSVFICLLTISTAFADKKDESRKIAADGVYEHESVQAKRGQSGIVCEIDRKELSSTINDRIKALNKYLSDEQIRAWSFATGEMKPDEKNRSVWFSKPYSVSAPSIGPNSVCVTVTKN